MIDAHQQQSVNPWQPALWPAVNLVHVSQSVSRHICRHFSELAVLTGGSSWCHFHRKPPAAALQVGWMGGCCVWWQCCWCNSEVCRWVTSAWLSTPTLCSTHCSNVWVFVWRAIVRGRGRPLLCLELQGSDKGPVYEPPPCLNNRQIDWLTWCLTDWLPV